MPSLLYPTTNLTQTEQLSIVRAEGIYVYDNNGKRYVEGLAGLWCAALGYGNEELIEAITGQLKELPYSHMFGGRTHRATFGHHDLRELGRGFVELASGIFILRELVTFLFA